MAASDLDTVQLQLEQLNIASDVINKFEIQLDEARQNFRDTQVLLTIVVQEISAITADCLDGVFRAVVEEIGHMH